MITQNKRLTKEEVQEMGILPAVWRGYDMPRSEISGKLYKTQGISVKPNNSPISQGSIDTAIETFQNGSVADFTGIYLSKFMNTEDHRKSLLLAQDILTSNVRTALKKENSYFVKIMALDIAQNALEYGDRLFKTACVLERSSQLPTALRFMFWAKMNPAYYREANYFETSERLLKEPLKTIPDAIKSSAFDSWMRKTESREYLSWMSEYACIEALLDEHQPNLLSKTITNIELAQRIGRQKSNRSYARVPFRQHH